MSRHKRYSYNVRWDGTHADVSFTATNDTNALRFCRSQAKKFGYGTTMFILSKSHVTIYIGL